MRQARPSERATGAPPLDADRLEALAVRYVGRYATTRAKLRDYLHRKVRERGWDGDAAAPVDALVARMAELKYVDDRAFAAAKGASLSRRGYGARRIGGALRAAGVTEDDGAGALEAAQDRELAAAVALAKRRRIGPFATAAGDPRDRERWIAILVRAGHAPRIARKVVSGDAQTLEDELEGQPD